MSREQGIHNQRCTNHGQGSKRHPDAGAIEELRQDGPDLRANGRARLVQYAKARQRMTES
jgi:hypothetical protein